MCCVCYCHTETKKTELLYFYESVTVHYPWEAKAGINPKINEENIHENWQYDVRRVRL